MDEAEKAFKATEQEKYALTLSQMPQEVRDDIAGNKRLSTISFAFFRLGFGEGSKYGLQVGKDILNG